jgi:hypothetical protein
MIYYTMLKDVYTEWPSILFGTYVVFVLEVQKANLCSSVL